MLRLYGYFRSSAAYRVRIALNLKGLEYETVPVHLLRNGGEQHTDTFRNVNPAQLVPVLEDGALILTQSLAIIEYLEESYPLPALLPQAPAERAAVRALASTVACDIHPINNLRVMQYLKSFPGLEEEQLTAWSHHWIELGFASIEPLLAQCAGSYSCGNTPSLADCCLIPQVFNALRIRCPLGRYPTVMRIYESCMAQDAFRRAAPEAQIDAV
jgi:maleylacetoacetate isomerase/maleylpyruvate isomerase